MNTVFSGPAQPEFEFPISTIPLMSSLSVLPQMKFNNSSIGFVNNSYKNCTYDKYGQLLFSVSMEGVHDLYGNLIYDFSNVDIDPCSFSTLGYAVSEIVVVPKPTNCNSYYILFWSDITNDGSGFSEHAINAILRAVEVDINPALYPGSYIVATTSNSAYQFTDNLPCSNAAAGTTPFSDWDYGTMEIVADAVNSDGSRDFYTVDIKDTGIYTSSDPHSTIIRKWTIESDGTLPTTFTQLTNCELTNTMINPKTTKAKLFHVANGFGGSDKTLAFVGSQWSSSGPLWGSVMQTYDLVTGTSAQYIAPYLFTCALCGSTYPQDKRNIWGFEYSSSTNTFYFSFVEVCESYDPAIEMGGLAFAQPASTSTPTLTINMVNLGGGDQGGAFRYSDLELDKNGNLYLVDAAQQISYYQPSQLGINFATVAPTTTSDTTYNLFNYLSVYSSNANSGASSSLCYLGNQIRGEDYSTWDAKGMDYVPYQVITGTVTWTPTNNPLTNITGVATSTIKMPSGIMIAPGGTLTVQGMTLEFPADSFITLLLLLPTIG